MSTTVGLRELKNKLSTYVAQARSGKSILITDRGHIIAELSPARRGSRAGEPTTTLEELRSRGVLHGGGKNDALLYPAMPRAIKRSSSSLLDEERGSH